MRYFSNVFVNAFMSCCHCSAACSCYWVSNLKYHRRLAALLIRDVFEVFCSVNSSVAFAEVSGVVRRGDFLEGWFWRR